jgi:hypothetical protein
MISSAVFAESRFKKRFLKEIEARGIFCRGGPERICFGEVLKNMSLQAITEKNIKLQISLM